MIDLEYGVFLKEVMPSAISTIVMTMALWVFTIVYYGHYTSGPVYLFASAIVGGAAYFLSLAFLFPSSFFEIYEFVSSSALSFFKSKKESIIILEPEEKNK